MNSRAILTTFTLCIGTTVGFQLTHAKSPPADTPAATKAAPPAVGQSASPAPAKGETARAVLKSADGKDIGEATLRESKHGILITANLQNLPAGAHAFHIHEVGKCEAPFKTAGGHWNPDGAKHGILSEGGKHAGDLPNIYVPESGKVTFEVLAAGVTLKPGQKNSVFDADGSALVVHAKADDNVADPAGNAGDRIACGVIQK